MIRVLALSYWAEQQHITAAEANMLCCGNPKFLKLFKVLPYTSVTDDWRQLVLAQKIAGIKPRFINEHRSTELTQMQFSRLKQYTVAPDAWVYDKEKCLCTYDEYVQYAKEFWNLVLKPVQLPTVSPTPLTTHTKWCILSKYSRSYTLNRLFRDEPDITEMLSALASMPISKVGDVRQQGDARFSKMCGVAQHNHLYSYSALSSSVRLQDEFVSRWEREICKVWSLFIRLQTEGMINSNLMEGINYDEYIQRYGT